jgi:predicted component of type VI protein secretion system
MAEKKTPIVIDEVEYFFEDMTAQQQTIVNHLSDLERKISTTRFNLDQLTVGRDAFVNMLKLSLSEEPKVEE